MLGSNSIANYVSRTVYINTEVSEIEYYTLYYVYVEHIYVRIPWQYTMSPIIPDR